MRWFPFIMGPLPQAIRLASFEGTPWTKAFGFSFLVAWIFIEVLILVAPEVIARNSVRLWVPGWDLRLPHPRTDVLAITFLDEVDGICLHLGVSATLLFLTITSILLGVPAIRDIFKNPLGITLVLVLLASACYVAVLFTVVDGIFRLLHRFCTKHLELGRNLNIVLPQDLTDTLQVDRTALRLFMFLCVNVLVCLVAYRYIYKSAGTSNPGWTGVFG